MEVIPDGSCMFTSCEQALKVVFPIEVNPSGSCTLSNPVQDLYLLLVDYQYYTL